MTNTSGKPVDAGTKSLNIMNSFNNGAKKGVNLVLNAVIPSVMFAFVLMRILMLSGIMDIIGMLFNPIMSLFGLPGEAAMPLVLSFVSLTGAISATASLIESGILTALHAVVILPCMFLFGMMFIYTGRVLGVTGIATKDYKYCYAMNIINGIISLFVMKIIVSFL